MYWLAVVILTALAVSLQTTVAPRIELWGARPDGLLVLVVFVALYGHRQRAIVIAWFIGISADLMSVERLGLISLSYAAVAMVLVTLRDYIFRYSVITQFVATFIVCVIVRTAWLAYARSLYDWPATAAGYVLGGAVYTAAWAPLIHGVLFRLAGMLGVSRPRRGPIGMRELGYADV